MTQNEILTQLIDLSHWLGSPDRDLAILGEGNTSATLGDGTFYVKASGTSLGALTPKQLVRCRSDIMLDKLKGDAPISDAESKAALEACRMEPDAPLPSVETYFHALLLRLEGVRFIGHTHPTSINSILCSQNGWDMIQRGRMFPDEIVVCGIAPCYVPYTDPGVVLSREIGRRVDAYIQDYGVRPKAILMQNHGFIALGKTAAEVQAIHAMWDKTARVLIGTMAFGGPLPLTPENIQRIYTRPDEHHRQRALGITDDGNVEK